MTDVVDRAKAVLKHSDTRIGHALVADLIAEIERLRAALPPFCWNGQEPVPFPEQRKAASGDRRRRA